MIRTIELVRSKEGHFRDIRDYELFEDELYFISQMFEKDWMPRDSYVSRVWLRDEGSAKYGSKTLECSNLD